MNVTTKYSIGDCVCGIRSSHMQKRVLCLVCNHTGEVTISGEKLICPKCNGAARNLKYVGHKWHFDVQGVVGLVRAEARNQYSYETNEQHEYDTQNQYMLDVTGIGSGSIWRESELWPSREEAEAECERRNAGIDWEDEILPQEREEREFANG